MVSSGVLTSSRPATYVKLVRLGCSVARALLEPILITLQVPALATNYQL
jgi:hypothetical protein